MVWFAVVSAAFAPWRASSEMVARSCVSIPAFASAAFGLSAAAGVSDLPAGAVWWAWDAEWPADPLLMARCRVDGRCERNEKFFPESPAESACARKNGLRG